MSLATGTADVFKAIGRPRVPLWATVAQFLVLLPALTLASTRGLNTVAAVAAAAAVVFAVGLHGLVGSVLAIRPGAMWASIKPPILTALLVYLAMAPSDRITPDTAVLALVIQLLVGALAGSAAIALVWPTLPRDLQHLLRPGRSN